MSEKDNSNGEGLKPITMNEVYSRLISIEAMIASNLNTMGEIFDAIDELSSEVRSRPAPPLVGLDDRWAFNFGAMFTRALQGDYDLVDHYAKEVQIDFKDGKPYIAKFGSPLVGLDFNLEELKKDWEDAFYDGKWEVDTLKLTGLEKQIITAMCDFLPRHMPEYDWNLPYAEAIILLIRRALAAKFGSPQKEPLEHKPITWNDGSQSCGSDCKICYPDPQKESGDEVEELAKLNCPTACCVPGRKLATDIINAGYRKPDPRFVEVGKIEWPKKMDISGFTEGRGRGSDAHMIAVATNSAIVACKAAVLKAGEKII